MHRELLQMLIGFDWDAGNSTKNQESHDVSRCEAEEVFVGNGLILVPDIGHSAMEERYYAFGASSKKRLLSIAFTLRNHRVRVIMARDMSRKERSWYEKEIKKNPSA